MAISKTVPLQQILDSYAVNKNGSMTAWFTVTVAGQNLPGLVLNIPETVASSLLDTPCSTSIRETVESGIYAYLATTDYLFGK